MTLGEFLKEYTHNNIIRLVYKNTTGHEVVLNNWNDVSMDWEVLKGKGKFRHFIDNKVMGIANINFPSFAKIQYPEAFNIVIEKLENQPIIEEVIDEKSVYTEAM
jgi:hypothetical protein